MPKMERYNPNEDTTTGISFEDLTFMINELFESWRTGTMYNDWERQFINDMSARLKRGGPFTEKQERAVKQVYDRHLSTGDINDV